MGSQRATLSLRGGLLVVVAMMTRVAFASIGGVSDDTIHTIDPATGAVTAVGSTGTGAAENLAFGPAAVVPEPSTPAPLLAGGFASLGMRLGRRRSGWGGRQSVSDQARRAAGRAAGAGGSFGGGDRCSGGSDR